MTADPVVVTTAGAVRGRWRPTPTARSAAFLGVPYAQAPVGDLRFAAPQRRTPWPGVRDAGAYGPTAQVRPLMAVTTIGGAVHTRRRRAQPHRVHPGPG